MKNVSSERTWLKHNSRFESDESNPLLAVSPWSGHRQFAFDLVSFLRPQSIVELGTHFGCSFFAFLQAVKDNSLQTQSIAIDTWKGDPHAGYYDDSVFDSFQSILTSKFNKLAVKVLRSSFDEALMHVADNSINLLHIDGYHTYEATKHDFETWKPKLAKDAVVLFHDISPSTGYGSAIYWEEIRSHFPHFEFPNHSFGLGVLFPSGEYHYEQMRSILSAEAVKIYEFEAKNELLRIQYEDLSRRFSDRWDAMCSMEAMIKDRDETILAQKNHLDERWNIICKMNESILERDQAIDSQARMIEQRWEISQKMEDLIRQKDDLISSQNLAIAKARDSVSHLEDNNRSILHAICVLKETLKVNTKGSTLSQGSLYIANAVKSFENEFGRNLPFVGLALSCFYFVKRLYDTTKSANISELIFFAREGQMLKEMFDFYQLINAQREVVKTHYIHISRRSMFLPSLDSLESEKFDILFRQYRNISANEFLRSLGLDAFRLEICSSLGCDISDLDKSVDSFPDSKLYSRILESPVFREYYEKERNARSNAFETYLRDRLGRSVPSTLHVVDVGWKGSIQDSLFKWLQKLHGSEARVCGYYVGLVARGNMSARNSKAGLLFSNVIGTSLGFNVFNENKSLFEILLHADHGSALSYEPDSTGKSSSVLDVFHEKEMIETEVLPSSKAIMKIFKSVVCVLNGKSVTDEEILKACIKRHEKLVFSPTPNEVAWMSRISHAENFGVFRESRFVSRTHNPNLLSRAHFTIDILRKKRLPSNLSFWPWLTMQREGFFGLSLVYKYYRTIFCR